MVLAHVDGGAAYIFQGDRASPQAAGLASNVEVTPHRCGRSFRNDFQLHPTAPADPPEGCVKSLLWAFCFNNNIFKTTPRRPLLRRAFTGTLP
jgi:hypothetical protein